MFISNWRKTHGILFADVKNLQKYLKEMYKVVVIYRDKIGSVAVGLDDNTVDFIDGIAYFDSDGKTYRIPIGSLIRITEE